MGPSPPRRALTAAATVAALVAFAANSILCRAALGDGAIDPLAFSLLRVAAGAAMLLLLLRGAPSPRLAPDWTAGAWLALYAVAFSWAYTRLAAGTGALVLFAAVQATLLGGALRLGERPRPAQWLGMGLAGAGLVALAAPGSAAPSLAGVAAMAAAGVGWGAYTLRGRRGGDPLRVTAGNFVAALPWVAAAAAVTLPRLQTSIDGAILAVASGAVASALGYVAWHAALRGLTAGSAAAVQLAVPVLAAAGGVVLLGEALTPRLLGAGVVVLSGVALALLGAGAAAPRRRSVVPSPTT